MATDLETRVTVVLLAVVDFLIWLEKIYIVGGMHWEEIITSLSKTPQRKLSID